jgi:hypothetical protein
MPQVPPVQMACPLAGTGQAVQLAPQCVGSSSVEKQVPPQLVSGATHEHWLDWHLIPPVQATPQLPQWASSVARLAHEPEHAAVPDGHPLVQANALPDAAHMGASAGHCVPQLPQCAGSERSVSQPSLGRVEQCA